MSGDQPGVWRPPARVTTFSADAIGQIGAPPPGPRGADAIVRALAACDEPMVEAFGDAFCSLCKASPEAGLDLPAALHEPSCPWRLAVEWVAEHPEARP